MSCLKCDIDISTLLILPIAINILLISMSLTASLFGMSSDESVVFFSPEQGSGRLLQGTAKAS